MELFRIINTILTRGLERFGLYYSSYRGIVVDNKDPQHLHRVKVQVPQVSGDYTINYWAWPIGIPSTPNVGFQWIPKVGEMVWVSFEFGDARRPLYNFGYRGNDDFIEDELKDYKLIWLRTKSGHKIVIDDSKNLIRIESSGGKVIDITDTISLGTREKSAEPAVLGNTLTSKLQELIDILENSKVNTMIGPQPFLPNTILELTTLKKSIKDIKSSIVTLD